MFNCPRSPHRLKKHCAVDAHAIPALCRYCGLEIERDKAYGIRRGHYFGAWKSMRNEQEFPTRPPEGRPNESH